MEYFKISKILLLVGDCITVRSAYSEPSGDHAIMFILQGLHIKQTCFSSLIMSSNLRCS